MQRRSTKQREEVYRALMTLYHPTADEIYARLCTVSPGIGRATVFRNLAILTEEGRATKLIFPDEVARYDANTDGHYHFVCRHCGQILDLPASPKLPLPQSDLFTAELSNVHFYGVCRKCVPNATNKKC